MKHDLKITIILIVFFVLAQVLGLALINFDISEIKSVDGEVVVVHEETALGPRPEMTGIGAFAYIAIGLIIGTLLVLLIIKLKKVKIWKIWFFLAVFLAITLALGVFLNSYIALVLGLLLAIFKIWRPNIFIHNITEVLMYAGIAVFLVPLLNVFWAAVLLVAISVYDIIAVFKSKHMVKMAKFQTKSGVFAGLLIPYTPKKNGLGMNLKKMVQPPKKIKAVQKAGKEFPKLKLEKKERKNAILGGGDIAFPLLFAGVVMESLVGGGLTKSVALFQSLIITLTTTIALALLFIYAKKDKFYPAMPIISAGCFIGYFIILLL